MKDLKILIRQLKLRSAANIKHLKQVDERKLILLIADLNHDKIESTGINLYCAERQ